MSERVAVNESVLIELSGILDDFVDIANYESTIIDRYSPTKVVEFVLQEVDNVSKWLSMVMDISSAEKDRYTEYLSKLTGWLDKNAPEPYRIPSSNIEIESSLIIG